MTIPPLPSEDHARLQICETGRALHEAGFLAGTAGNLSVRLAGDRVVLTPRGVRTDTLEPDGLVTVELAAPDPEALAAATTEWPLHRESHRTAPDVGAVIHSHAPALTAVGLGELDITEVLPEIEQAAGPFATVGFAPSGSEELGRRVGEAVGAGARLLLLRRHGVLSLGATLQDALDAMELAELGARAVLLAAGASS